MHSNLLFYFCTNDLRKEALQTRESVASGWDAAEIINSAELLSCTYLSTKSKPKHHPFISSVCRVRQTVYPELQVECQAVRRSWTQNKFYCNRLSLFVFVWHVVLRWFLSYPVLMIQTNETVASQLLVKNFPQGQSDAVQVKRDNCLFSLGGKKQLLGL